MDIIISQLLQLNIQLQLVLHMYIKKNSSSHFKKQV